MNPETKKKIYFRELRGVLLSIFILIYNCNITQKEELAPKEIEKTFTLSFSNIHQKYYHHVKSSSLNEREAQEFFDNTIEKSNTICEMIWGKRKFQKEYIETLIPKENFGKRPFETWAHPLPKMIVGCWNFFRMNDVTPHKDFELVKNLYPDIKKDCFSVGFMQPYIMHNILGCERLTVVDIDLRIHHGHWQLIKILREKKLVDINSLNEALKTLNIGWVAFEEQEFGKNMKVNITSLCKPAFAKYCAEHLLQFQNNLDSLKSFRLVLSFLHDADYTNLENTIPVIYFSNALETIYTSKEEFFQILSKIDNALKVGEKAVLIYHAGGQENFGIYEYLKNENSHSVKTVCRDNYFAGFDGNYHIYTTYFEKNYPSNEKVPSCKTHPYLVKKK